MRSLNNGAAAAPHHQSQMEGPGSGPGSELALPVSFGREPRLLPLLLQHRLMQQRQQLALHSQHSHQQHRRYSPSPSDSHSHSHSHSHAHSHSHLRRSSHQTPLRHQQHQGFGHQQNTDRDSVEPAAATTASGSSSIKLHRSHRAGIAPASSSSPSASSPPPHQLGGAADIPAANTTTLTSTTSISAARHLGPSARRVIAHQAAGTQSTEKSSQTLHNRSKRRIVAKGSSPPAPRDQQGHHRRHDHDDHEDHEEEEETLKQKPSNSVIPVSAAAAGCRILVERWQAHNLDLDIDLNIDIDIDLDSECDRFFLRGLQHEDFNQHHQIYHLRDQAHHHQQDQHVAQPLAVKPPAYAHYHHSHRHCYEDSKARPLQLIGGDGAAMPPSALLDPGSGGASRKQGQQSNLAKLVMNGSLASTPPRSTPANSSPALTSSPTYSDIDHLSVLPPPARNAALLTPAMAATAMPSALKAMHDLTDTPQLPLSLNSTAPNSPRMPPLRQNSGTTTPRVRPHATTLNIPGMTRSKVSPDGRIPQRDVAAKLVIIMVGLPARGKSYITKKLQRYLSWQQHESQVFNVGNRRRKTAGKTVHAHPKLSPEPSRLDPPVHAAAAVLFNGIQQAAGLHSPGYFEPSAFDLNQSEAANEDEDEEEQSAQFFDPKNSKAAKVREQVAMETLDELIDYLLEGGGSVGILDATNSTLSRRQHLVERIKQREPKLGILFIESICRDKKLLEANMRLKLYGPDYRDKDPLQSLVDFKQRVAAYESAYVPLGDYEEENDLQYIQMVDVGRKLVQHRLRGFLSGGISTYLGSFNLSPRQIWITRHGQSRDNESGKLGGDSPLTERGHCYAQALHRFITHKRKEWLINEKSKEAQASFPPLPGDNTPPYPEKNRELEEKNFCVWTSMLQRSVETAEYFDVDDDYDVKNWEMLNELNAGQFEGMTYADIAREHPGEFNKRTRDKLNYIYPGVGGEGYLQVISRLRDMVREMERITDHALIIGHRSVCRVLMAYFMDLTREDITDMDVPLGALYAIEPKPYGIAFHAYKYNEQQGWFDEVPNHTPTRAAQGSD